MSHSYEDDYCKTTIFDDCSNNLDIEILTKSKKTIDINIINDIIFDIIRHYEEFDDKFKSIGICDIIYPHKFKYRKTIIYNMYISELAESIYYTISKNLYLMDNFNKQIYEKLTLNLIINRLYNTLNKYTQ